jgi:membrane protein involved in colicin uptake
MISPARLARAWSAVKGFYVRRILIIVLFVLSTAVPAWGQDVSAVELQIERLRAQLRDVVDLEARLQDRASRLEEDLRPESIERSVAAVGTTDAAALRAARREQIEKQKADVNGQLSEAAARRAKLEAEIAAAEAEAVRLKAAALGPGTAAPRPAPAAAPAPPASAPNVTRRAPARKRAPRKRIKPRRRA